MYFPSFSSVIRGHVVAHYVDACSVCTVQSPHNCLWRGRGNNRMWEMRIKMHVMNKADWMKLEGGCVWSGCCVLFTDVPYTHWYKVWNAAVLSGCGFQQVPSKKEWGPQDTAQCDPPRQRENWTQMQGRSSGSVCILLLARGHWHATWEWQQELGHHICCLKHCGCTLSFN